MSSSHLLKRMVIFEETIHALKSLVSRQFLQRTWSTYTMYKPTLREDGLSGCAGPFESRGSFAYVAIGINVECKRMYDERMEEEKHKKVV